MKKNTIMLLALMGCLTISMATLAGSGKSKGKKDRHARFEKKLGLSAEQSTALKSHRESAKSKKVALKEKIKLLKDNMKAGFDNNSSEAELKVIHNQIKAVKSEMADLKFEKMTYLRSILTDEQKSKLSNMREERKDKNGKHHNKCEK